jgi:predicted deacylase
MPPELPARGVRVGGTTVSPGEARVVSIRLAAREGQADAGGADPAAAGEGRAIPAWIAVGAKAGPRVSVVAALRGCESGASAAAALLASQLDASSLAGSVVVVPVLRVGGRFAPRGGRACPWRFPGDAGGDRAARDAFTLFSDIAVGVGALVVLGAPGGGRRGSLTVRGRLDDPRVRRLAMQTGALAAMPLRRRRGSLLEAAADAGVVALELSAAGGPGEDAATAEVLAGAVRALLSALGVSAGEGGSRAGEPAPARAHPAAPLVVEAALRVRAPAGGLLSAAVLPGTFVRSGGLLARVAPPLPGRALPVAAPADVMVLEAPGAPATRKGAVLYVLAPTTRAAAKRRVPQAPANGAPGAAPAGEAKLRVGWVEHVTLPDLDITRLKAKIDTGARTSALHVARMRTVDTAGGPQRRPILEITVPGGGRGRKPRRVRAAVREYVVVRDTSGRMERRPVIETALQLGPFRRRISVTLTFRGDMLFPMLIGRTALGAGIVVDPARRYLLGRGGK